MNTLSKITLSILICFTLSSCTKTTTLIPDEPAKKTEDLKPELFEVNVSDIAHNFAVLKWSESFDPEYDEVTYTVELEEKQIASKLTTKTFKLENLSPSHNYKGKIIAIDPKGNSESVLFEFTTSDGFIKFFKTIYLENPAGMEGRSILATSDGGYIIGGRIAFESWNTLFVKVSLLGEVEWYKTLDIYPGNPKLVEVPGGYAMSSADYIFKFDLNGNLIWKKQIDLQGTTAQGELYSITLTKDNHLVVVGQEIEDYPFPVTDKTMLSKAAVIKLDLNGQIIWKKLYGDKRRNQATDLVEDQNGNLYLCGDQETGYDLSSLWQFKLDKNGTLLWSRTYENTGFSFAQSIRITSDNKLITCGFSSSITYRIYLVKTELNGNLVKMIKPQFNFAETAYGMVNTTDGGVAISTSMEGSYVSKAGLLKYDTELNLEWNKTYPGKQYGVGRSLLQTADKGFILTGATYGTTTSAGPAGMILIKTNSKGDYE
jgi:hypothetical protein